MEIDKMQKIRKIGSGTFGDVILYEDCNNSMKYALKRVYLAFDGENLEKNGKSPLNEVKVLQSLDHVNIIKYYDSFVTKNKLCILMEYADEGDLLQKVRTVKEAQTHICEEDILFWLAQVSLAVKYLWDRKILHRDIKLQNIFLTKPGLIKLGDFGISKRLDHTGELAKTSLGTPYYLSPEICSSSHYDHKTDIWMIGCAIHELCSLSKPFSGDSLNAVIFKIMNEKHSAIPKAHGYSDFLLNLIDKMLEKAPENRPDVYAILSETKIRREIVKLAANYPGYQDLLDKEGIHLDCSPLLMQPASHKKINTSIEEKISNPPLESKSLKSEKLAQNSIHYLIQKAKQTSQGSQNVCKQTSEMDSNKAVWEKKSSDEDEKEGIELVCPKHFPGHEKNNFKKTYHKNILINTAGLEPQYQERPTTKGASDGKDQPKEAINANGSVGGDQDESNNVKEILTDKVRQKNFSFAGAIFNPKAPTSPNRSILFSEFLKQRLGEGKFLKMKQLLESSDNPMKILNEQRKTVAEIIGEENLDCVKIFKFLISSSATPPSGAINFGSLSLKKEMTATPVGQAGRDAFEGGLK